MTTSLIDSLLLGAGHSLVRPVMVIDTKAAINSACYRVRTGHPGLLERAIQPRHLGLIPLLTPRHVPEEVDEHLAARAREEGLDPDAVTQIWTQRLRPHIRVIDLAIRDPLDPRLRGVLADDPDDLPTAALARWSRRQWPSATTMTWSTTASPVRPSERRPPVTCSSSPRRTGSWSACSPP